LLPQHLDGFFCLSSENGASLMSNRGEHAMINWLKRYHIPIDTMGGLIATGITIGAFVIAYG